MQAPAAGEHELREVSVVNLGYPNFVSQQDESFRARLDRSTRRALFLGAVVLTVVVLVELSRAV